MPASATRFTNAVNLAQKLVDKNGRQVTLLTYSRTTFKDAAKPWRGRDRTTSTSTTITAAFFDSNEMKLQTANNELTGIAKTATVAFVDAKTLADTVPSEKDQLLDGTTTWEITNVEVVKPADTAILYILGVEK